MSELTDRYHDIRTEFDLLVMHGTQIADSLAGKDAQHDRDFYADRVFSKLLCHAITLRRISPSASGSGSTELWDISSAAALARALIESFDALSYVAVEDVAPQEREFRILLWKLHAEERRQKMLALIGSSATAVVTIDAAVLALRSELLAHPLLHSNGPDLAKRITKCDAPPFHLGHMERNKRSGVDHDYYNAAIMFLSAYVHTFPFSVHQLMEFRAGNDESLRLMSMPIQYSLGFLSKAIDGMHSVFGLSLPIPDEATSKTLRTWVELLDCGIRHVG